VPFAAAALEVRTPVMALRMFGVIVAPPDTDELIMLRKATVLGDGSGDDTGPPMRGVRPVPGVSPVRGVRPIRKLDGSNRLKRECAIAIGLLRTCKHGER
jgi:hypothetical protein